MMTPTYVGPVEGMWFDHTRKVRISNGMEFTYCFEDGFEDDGDCRKNLHLARQPGGTVLDLRHTYDGSLAGQELIDSIEAALARKVTHFKWPTL